MSLEAITTVGTVTDGAIVWTVTRHGLKKRSVRWVFALLLLWLLKTLCERVCVVSHLPRMEELHG